MEKWDREVKKTGEKRSVQRGRVCEGHNRGKECKTTKEGELKRDSEM